MTGTFGVGGGMGDCLNHDKFSACLSKTEREVAHTQGLRQWRLLNMQGKNKMGCRLRRESLAPSLQRAGAAGSVGMGAPVEWSPC
jgi:hypothetical protein